MTYKTSNNGTTVKELNANVCPATFPGTGSHAADLYTSANECDTIVYSGSCAPVNSTFVRSINIELN